jgi:FMN-dependent NADH-azoreductase
MTNILRIDSSSRLEGSYSRQVGDLLEKALVARTAGARVSRRDLGAKPIEHIRNTTIAGYYTPADKMTAELKAATAVSDDVIGEVKAADILLITTPMYNFSIPSSLKAWIDQLVRIGQTFAYDGKSFTGLLPGRKAYVVVAYGAGGYTNGGPFEAADFVQPYLKFLLGFLGITDVTFITVESTTGDGDTIAREMRTAETAIAASLGGGMQSVMMADASDQKIGRPLANKSQGILAAIVDWFAKPKTA